MTSTQFFEFIDGIADAATTGNEGHMAPVAFQPIAADDVASVVAEVAMNSRLNGRLEIAGPDQLRFDGVGGAESWGEHVGEAMKLAADDVQSVVISATGHWVAKLAPDEMLAALTAFLAQYRSRA